jgi:nucleoside-diphosphate-sugar epimerase
LDAADADRPARGVLVPVTGGEGYVGSHAIAALIAAGHRVRVLARAPERVASALGPLGIDGVDAKPGDVTDQRTRTTSA